ncbi:MAG: signal peptidase I [Polyangiaceae bacterium]
MRYVFYVVWVLCVPVLLSWGLVWLVSPANMTDDVGVLRKFVGGQRIPCGIFFFGVFALLLWWLRHDLPLAFAIGPGRRDLPPKVRKRFEEAGALLAEARRILKAKKRQLDKALTFPELERVRYALDELDHAMADEPFSVTAFDAALGRADRAVGEHLGRWRKGEVREIAESVLIAFAVAAMVRVAVFEPFKIPTGSMIPTLMVGDHIFVNKASYGPLIPFTDKRIWDSLPPERGEVMVFKFPEKPEIDYIKRVIAGPNDTLEVLDGRPIINGWIVPRCDVGTFDMGALSEGTHELYVEFLEGKAYFTQYLKANDDKKCKVANDCANGQLCKAGYCGSDLKGPWKVAPREVWVMGDNRDNSHDSRAWRMNQGAGVPFDNIRGRAMFVFATVGSEEQSFWDRFLVNVTGRPTLASSMSALKPKLDQCLREMPKDTTPPAPTK